MRLLYVFLIAMTYLHVSAQNQNPTEWREYRNSEYLKSINEYYMPAVTSNNDDLQEPVTLSVVIHYVYNEYRPNVYSAQKALKYVERLNRDFEGFSFKKNVPDSLKRKHKQATPLTNIQFCLGSSKRKYNVTHTQTDSLQFVHLQSVKSAATGGIDPWNPEKYINIWVCDLAYGAGYAQPPGFSSEYDGIVIDIDFFKQMGGNIPYNKGKTLTHLMGNYLGLIDLWGLDYCQDDGLEDTPIHNAPNYTLPDLRHVSLCDGKEELLYNFMDNSPDSVLYYFTKDQVRLMHHTLLNERHSLIENPCNQVIRKRSVSINTPVEINPNPAINFIDLFIPYTELPTVKCSIFDAAGRLIVQDDVATNNDSAQHTFSLHAFAAGVYTIKVELETKTEILKFVKL